MESSLTRELQELSAMVSTLAAQRDEALGKLDKALEEVADLQRQLEADRKEAHRKDLDIEFLTVSHKLADSPEALARARATVKGMLARVEKAIALLKGDAGM